MTNNSPAQELVFQSIPYSKKLMKSPFFVLPISADMLPNMGMIIALWGFYEDLFDRLMKAMVSETGKEPGPGWQRRPYKNRLRLFKRKIKTCFKDQPTILTMLQAIARESTELHNRRNLLAHGRLVIWFKGTETTFESHGFLKQKAVKETITSDWLAVTMHDLCHLCGRLHCVFDPNHAETPISPLEKSFLQEFWNRNSPTSPTEDKPSLPHLSLKMTGGSNLNFSYDFSFDPKTSRS